MGVKDPSSKTAYIYISMEYRLRQCGANATCLYTILRGKKTVQYSLTSEKLTHFRALLKILNKINARTGSPKVALLKRGHLCESLVIFQKYKQWFSRSGVQLWDCSFLTSLQVIWIMLIPIPCFESWWSLRRQTDHLDSNFSCFRGNCFVPRLFHWPVTSNLSTIYKHSLFLLLSRRCNPMW